MDARVKPAHDGVVSRMRIRISHATTYRYDTPPNSVIQMLRLTPRNHDGQYVANWRVDLSEDCLLHQHEDAFGNISHFFTAEGPFRELSISVEGEVDTHDTKSVVNGAVERFPPGMFLRETALTEPDDAIIDFADSTRAAAGSDSLVLLHGLMTGLNREIAFDTDPTHSATTAAEAFALRRGVCQDLTHIFIAAARRLEIPARYVGGHFYRTGCRDIAGRRSVAIPSTLPYRRFTCEEAGYHDILLRNPGARRISDDCRYAHQCRSR